MSSIGKNLLNDAPGWRPDKRFVGVTLLVMVAAVGLFAVSTSSSFRSRFSSAFGATRPSLVVFSSYSDSPIARKQRRLLAGIRHIVLQPQEQRRYVNEYCNESLLRYDEFYQDYNAQHLATELWKYCALSSGMATSAVYLDLTNPVLLENFRNNLHQLVNMAILSSDYEPNTVHGSLLMLQETQQSSIALSMLQVLTQTPVKKLLQKPLLLPKLLYALLAQDLQAKDLQPGQHKDWILLQQHCHMSAHATTPIDDNNNWLDSASVRSVHTCPALGDFCCSVHDHDNKRLVMMNRHPLHPVAESSLVDSLPLPLPLHAGPDWRRHEDLPFITTLRVEQQTEPSRTKIKLPERFDDLLRNSCLPSDACNTCLAEYDGCSECTKECGCYCKTLCKEQSVTTPVTLRLVAHPPAYHRDSNRLIPRIIHQTWHEPITAEEYPDSSRLAQSFLKSGWDYRFYTNADAMAFLTTHFPTEVLQAYEALVSSRLQSHLFRYCLVFIFGGLYTDLDVLLESNLDLSIEPDVGFIAPLDEPSEVDSCLSKSFFAAAPGHPFLARAIEILVNQVRNRYSLVDMDHSFCPNPDLFSIRSDKTSFVTGSCLLGTSVNAVLGRPRIFPFGAGEVDHSHVKLPGRTIVLQQNRHDMGGNRYTAVDRNLIVAVADVEVSEEGGERAKFANQTKEFGGRFEFDALYRDLVRAHEEIQIQVMIQTA